MNISHQSFYSKLTIVDSHYDNTNLKVISYSKTGFKMVYKNKYNNKIYYLHFQRITWDYIILAQKQ